MDRAVLMDMVANLQEARKSRTLSETEERFIADFVAQESSRLAATEAAEQTEAEAGGIFVVYTYIYTYIFFILFHIYSI